MSALLPSLCGVADLPYLHRVTVLSERLRDLGKMISVCAHV